MTDRVPRALALSFAWMAAVGNPGAWGGEKPSGPPRKVLVELQAATGTGRGPAASEVLGQLAGHRGHGPDWIVPLYFPAELADRHPADLPASAAPPMVVDGRVPVGTSDPEGALKALHRALREPVGVALDLKREGSGSRRTFSVRIAARSPGAAGRELRVAVALTEASVATPGSGAGGAGRPLVEHHVVRRFEEKAARLDRVGSRTLTFPLELAPGQDPSKFRVAAFVQDRATGAVHQADVLAWSPAAGPGLALGRRKPSRVAARPIAGFNPGVGPTVAQTPANRPADETRGQPGASDRGPGLQGSGNDPAEGDYASSIASGSTPFDNPYGQGYGFGPQFGQNFNFGPQLGQGFSPQSYQSSGGQSGQGGFGGQPGQSFVPPHVFVFS